MEARAYGFGLGILSEKFQEDAFAEWKRLQNLLDSLPNISFLVLTWRLFQWPVLDQGDTNLELPCGVMLVFMMVGVSYWSASSCYVLWVTLGGLTRFLFEKKQPKRLCCEGDLSIF